MRQGRIERDGVPGPELVLVEADPDSQGAGDYVAVLAALMAHQRLVDGGGPSHLVVGVQEIHPLFAPGGELFPAHPRVQLDDLALLGVDEGRGARLEAVAPRLGVLRSPHQMIQ